MSVFLLWEPGGLFVYLMQGFLYVSCPLIGWISLRLSHWLSPASYPEEELAGRWTRTQTCTLVHIHTGRLLDSPIEIGSLSEACIPAYQTLLAHKRSAPEETPWWAPSVCLSRRCFHIEPSSGVDLDGLPSSQWAYKWIYHHSYLFIPSIPPRMSPRFLCNEHVCSGVLF